MAPLPYRWHPANGHPYELAEPLQTSSGEWLCAARWADTKQVFTGSSAATAAEALAGVQALLAFSVAARRMTGPAFPRAATEPTPAGLQYVMPGCEKDQTRGPVQMSLF